MPSQHQRRTSISRVDSWHSDFVVNEVHEKGEHEHGDDENEDKGPPPSFRAKVWTALVNMTPEVLKEFWSSTSGEQERRDRLAPPALPGDSDEPDDIGDPLQKIPIPMEDEGHPEVNAIDAYIQYFKSGGTRKLTHKETEWFAPGTTQHYWRGKCRRWCEDWRFNAFYTFVIFLNSISLGLSVNGDLDDDFTWVGECVFTLLYLIEITVRCLGSLFKPWHYPSLWIDGFLVTVSVFDVWVMKLLEYANIATRPNMSVVMCLRLFRFSRLFHAADKLAEFARPVRLLKGAVVHAPSLSAGIVLLTFWFIFLAAVTLMNAARQMPEDEPVREEFFTSSGETMLTIIYLLSKQFNSSEVTDGLDEAERGKPASIWFRVVAFLIKCILVSVVLSVFVEQLAKEGRFDDQLQTIKRKRREFDQGNLKYVLSMCMPPKIKNNGYGKARHEAPDVIRVRAMTDALMNFADERFTWKKKEHRDLFAMSAEDAVQLLKETDKKKEGTVTINSFLLNLFQKRCTERSVSEMVLDHDLRLCKVQIRESHAAVAKFQRSLCNREEKSKDEEPEHGGDPHEAQKQKPSEESLGLQQNVQLALGSIVERRTEAETVFWCIDELVGQLLGDVKSLNSLISDTDWDDEENVPEGAIKIASLQFQSQLENLTNYLEMWAETSMLAEAEIDAYFNQSMPDDDLTAPLCSVCEHRHHMPDGIEPVVAEDV